MAVSEQPDPERFAKQVAAWADEGVTSFKAYRNLRSAELQAAVQQLKLLVRQEQRSGDVTATRATALLDAADRLLLLLDPGAIALKPSPACKSRWRASSSRV